MVKLTGIISKLEDRDLTGADIIRLSHNTVNVYTYEEILQYDTLEGLLGRVEAAVILYQTKANYGHWVLVMKTKSGSPSQPGHEHIEFFDPYAMQPDEELKLSTYNLKQHRGEMVPYLSYLIGQSGLPLKVNNYRLQKFARHVNTCGRWCAIRALWREIPLTRFAGIFTSNDNYDPDFWVSAITMLS